MDKNRRPFVWMLLTATLCNIIFQMLRSSKDTVVVNSAGAEIVPYLFFWGVLPVSLIMTWLLTRALHRFDLRTLFPLTALCFLAYFLFFSFFLYPYTATPSQNLPLGLGLMLTHWSSVLYYVGSELWKVALLTILFWATLNRYTQVDRAKRLYPPVMVSVCLGGLIGGALTVLASNPWFHRHFPLGEELWPHSLRLQTITITALAFAMAFSYRQMVRNLVPKEEEASEPPPRLSLKNFFGSRLLILLAIIQFVDYGAYSLGHVLFLDTVKMAHPEPHNYSNFMGSMTFWTGIIQGITALFIAPYLWRKLSWTSVAMVTPVVLLITIALFLGFRWGGAPLPLTLFAGALYFVLCRAAKYTLLDSSKEIALIPLDRNLQLEGKLAMDGIAARGGRVTASLLQISLLSLYGGVGAALPATAVVILALSFIWIGATKAIRIREEPQTA